ncbi:carbohydrate ABC transporter permease [Cryobacterium sp. Y82]|uniref:carbohydrate ABC transporter permease n=1 Tax=Cryobacterium sp. Y82 TaxID=2045017 RepID=UPI000CE551C3|nr:carbohydrate ABC transporter permease [Cryobacterium sp. Y82]
MTTTDEQQTTLVTVAPTAAAPPRDSSKRQPTPAARAKKILITAILLVAAVYFLLPIYWVIIASTKSTPDLFGSNGFLFANPQLWTNIADTLAYNNGIFVRWLGNSLLYSGVGAVGATLFAAMGGYAVAKYKFKGKELVFGTVLAGVLIPATATAIPLYLLFSWAGLGNTYWSVLVPTLVSPFGFYLSRIYAETAVPDSLLEAARLDGAGEIKIFFTIGLRLMTPALVTVFLFQVVGVWNNYLLPLVMLADERLYPLTLGMTTWQAGQDRDAGLFALTVTGSLLSIIPLMIAMVIMQRFWRGGLTEGATK